MRAGEKQLCMRELTLHEHWQHQEALVGSRKRRRRCPCAFYTEVVPRDCGDEGRTDMPTVAQSCKYQRKRGVQSIADGLGPQGDSAKADQWASAVARVQVRARAQRPPAGPEKGHAHRPYEEI